MANQIIRVDRFPKAMLETRFVVAGRRSTSAHLCSEPIEVEIRGR